LADDIFDNPNYTAAFNEEGTMSEVDGQSFKNILACWAAGITVASVSANNDWQAITVNSFASVSMIPPLICLNVANRLLACNYMASEGHFAISILSDQQLDLGKRFAGYFDEQLDNRFDGLTCETTALGDPIIPRAMAWLSCTVEEQINFGENTMFVGRVREGAWTDDKTPLLYHNRRWGIFQATEDK
jgi:flavin reductase (DIM6/NTAB) family NADH-FMN oxidoreductase RutF